MSGYLLHSITYLFTVTDVNECEINNGGCGIGTCINTYRSFECRCPYGYIWDGTQCVGKTIDLVHLYTCIILPPSRAYIKREATGKK